MIRPFTLLCFCAFATAGAWLYQVKHSVAVKDRELAEVRRQTEQARQRIEILRAEWALLNEPDRLRQTATRVLTLEPMQPQNFLRITEFERRLPAAVAFAGAPSLFAAPPVATTPAATPAAPVMLAAASVPAPSARPAAQPAPAEPRRATPAELRVPEAPAPQALAATIAAQRAEQAARPAPAPRPAAQPAPRPIQPAVHVTPAPAAPAPQPQRMAAPVAPPQTTVISALGGATSLGRPMLAPPVPIGSAAAATLHGQGAPAPVPMR